MANDGEEGAAAAAAHDDATEDNGGDTPGAPTVTTPASKTKRSYRKGTDSGGRFSDIIGTRSSKRTKLGQMQDEIVTAQTMLDMRDGTPEGKHGKREANALSRQGGQGGKWRTDHEYESASWRLDDQEALPSLVYYQGEEGKRRIERNKAVIQALESYNPPDEETDDAASTAATEDTIDVDVEDSFDDHLGKAIVSLDDIDECLRGMSCETCMKEREKKRLLEFQSYLECHKSDGDPVGDFLQQQSSLPPPSFYVLPTHNAHDSIQFRSRTTLKLMTKRRACRPFQRKLLLHVVSVKNKDF